MPLDSSKKNKSTQKVVIPKGTINPNETTIIEIPVKLQKQSVLVAKSKPDISDITTYSEDNTRYSYRDNNTAREDTTYHENTFNMTGNTSYRDNNNTREESYRDNVYTPRHNSSYFDNNNTTRGDTTFHDTTYNTRPNSSNRNINNTTREDSILFPSEGGCSSRRSERSGFPDLSAAKTLFTEPENEATCSKACAMTPQNSRYQNKSYQPTSTVGQDSTKYTKINQTSYMDFRLAPAGSSTLIPRMQPTPQNETKFNTTYNTPKKGESLFLGQYRQPAMTKRQSFSCDNAPSYEDTSARLQLPKNISCKSQEQPIESVTSPFDLTRTEINERMMLQKDLEDFQQARRKLYLNATNLAKKTSLPYCKSFMDTSSNMKPATLPSVPSVSSVQRSVSNTECSMTCCPANSSQKSLSNNDSSNRKSSTPKTSTPHQYRTDESDILNTDDEPVVCLCGSNSLESRSRTSRKSM